jgi:hypothetical protein
MTLAMSFGLQKAVYAELAADTDLAALLPAGIHDAAPPGAPAGPFALIGEEVVREHGSTTHEGAQHDFTVSVVGPGDGFAAVKAASARVTQVLTGSQLVLERGLVTNLRFVWARAERGEAPDLRRIALRFRATTEDTI